MSGRGLGKPGIGKGGARRHRKVLRDSIQGITKPAIRRLARRGGVTRISGLVYEEVRGVLKEFLLSVIKDACIFTEHARRNTVSALDVVYALKRRGKGLYGFGDLPLVPQAKSHKPRAAPFHVPHVPQAPQHVPLVATLPVGYSMGSFGNSQGTQATQPGAHDTTGPNGTLNPSMAATPAGPAAPGSASFGGSFGQAFE